MRYIQYFEGENHQLSMMRLMIFLSFWPASYIALSIKTTESLAVYLGAYVGGVVGGKGMDAWSKKRGEDVRSIESRRRKS